MKRLVVVVLLASLSTACSLGKTGSRGPQIGRTTTVEQPAQQDDAAQREVDLGQR